MVRVRLEVVELQKRRLGALPAAGRDVGAPATIARPDGALDVLRRIARRFGGGAIRPGTDSPARTRLRNHPELLLLDLPQKQERCAIEDRSRVAIRDLPAKKSLEAPKPVMGFLADRELHAVALWGRRPDDRPRCRCKHCR